MPSQKVPLQSVKNNPNNPSVRDVEPKEVMEKSDQLLLIDVRTAEELVGELGKVKGITHIPLDQLGLKVSELPQNKTIVFICRSGNRSATAAAFAQDEGLDVYNMAGGMLLWNELDLPVERKS